MNNQPSLSAQVSATPFRVNLAGTFRSITAREGVLLHGRHGWGEFSPFLDYTPTQDAYWLVAALESIASPWPIAERVAVEVNAILPSGSATDTAIWAREAVAKSGCRTIKLKVAERSLTDDFDRVAAVRQAFNDAEISGHIRIDANGLWSPNQAEAAVRVLAPNDLEYVEQPCASVPELLELRRRSLPVAVAVDETLRRDRFAGDLTAIADVAVVKIGPFGGWKAARQLVAAIPIPVVFSGAMETSIGLARDVAFVASLDSGQSVSACGFGTAMLLAEDLVQDPLMPNAGAITVPTGSLAPDSDLLDQAHRRLLDHQSTGAQRWLDRLDMAHEMADELGLLVDLDHSRWAMSA